MAEALVAGIVKGKLAEPEFLFATDISPTRLELLKDRYHILVGPQNLDAVSVGGCHYSLRKTSWRLNEVLGPKFNQAYLKSN